MLIASLALVLFRIPIEQEISFKTSDGLELHGSLMEPAGKKRSKAVLLLPGSGPTDRDGNEPGYKSDVLKQMAEALAQAGVASYRFDKRAAGVNVSQWPKEREKLDEFFALERQFDDAEIALETLRRQPGIDTRHVGIAGHSEGGMFAICLGQKLGVRKVSGIGLLDAAGRPLDVVLEEQVQDLLEHQTHDAATQKKFMDNLRASIDYVKANGTHPPGVLPGLAAIFSPGTSKYWQSVMKIDPPRVLAEYPGNVFMLQGELDNQVSITKDFPLLRDAAAHRKSGRLTTFIVPCASHCIKHVDHLGDAGIDGPVVPEAAKQFSDWAAKEL